MLSNPWLFFIFNLFVIFRISPGSVGIKKKLCGVLCFKKSEYFVSVLVTLLLIVSPISAKYLLNSVAILALSVIYSELILNESGKRGLVKGVAGPKNRWCPVGPLSNSWGSGGRCKPPGKILVFNLFWWHLSVISGLYHLIVNHVLN